MNICGAIVAKNVLIGDSPVQFSHFLLPSLIIGNDFAVGSPVNSDVNTLRADRVEEGQGRANICYALVIGGLINSVGKKHYIIHVITSKS